EVLLPGWSRLATSARKLLWQTQKYIAMGEKTRCSRPQRLLPSGREYPVNSCLLLLTATFHCVPRGVSFNTCRKSSLEESLPTANNNNAYDLIVVGSGPAGQKAAICAAKLRKKVAIVERKRTIGGVCVHTGTIPSKTFREAILYLSGLRQRTFYGRGYALKENISKQDLVFRSDAVMAREIEVIKSQLRRNRVVVYEGNARFLDLHSVEVASEEGYTLLRGSNFVIACGTRPAHNADIPIDGKHIFDSDQVHELEELPRELIVVGAGIIGLEYASMFAALGVKVTLLDQRPTLLEFVDHEL